MFALLCRATAPGQALPTLYHFAGIFVGAGDRPAGGRKSMIFLALAMFVSLFGWGAQYFGWSDPVGKVQLALFTSFILGMICGYKNQG
jgi:hypothetical protein